MSQRRAAYADLSIKRGDTRPWLVASLREADGNPMDVSEVTRVDLTVVHVPSGTHPVVEQEMELLDEAEARYRYKWPMDALDRLGDHGGVIRLYWGDSPYLDRQTVPTRGHIRIHVESELPEGP